MPTRIEMPPSIPGENAPPPIAAHSFAAIRRETCAEISEAVSRLEIHADIENFNARASDVAESIRDLIARLTDAKEEGNSREILRQARDTFLNGGWEDYRSPGLREAAARVLDRLANAAEDITPDGVDAAEAELEKGGIRASLPVGLFVEVPTEEESEPK